MDDEPGVVEIKSRKRWWPELADFVEKETCQTCGQPDKTRWHRRRCLSNSEKGLMKILKDNKEGKTTVCLRCKGEGKLGDQQCPICEGTGKPRAPVV